MTRKERRDQKMEMSCSFWELLLKSKDDKEFTNDEEGDPNYFFVGQTQEYLQTAIMDWKTDAMRIGFIIHVGRVLDAEHAAAVNAALSAAYNAAESNHRPRSSMDATTETGFCIRCSRYRMEAVAEAAKKKRALRELESKLDKAESKVVAMNLKAKEMENLVLVRTKYKKLTRQEDKTKHEKKVQELEAVINGVKAQNRYKERQIQQLKHKAAHRGYDWGLQITMPN